MLTEASLERALVRWCRHQDMICIKVGFSGWPDRLIIRPDGTHVWLELKSKIGRVSPLQKRRVAQLVAVNAPVVVVRTKEECIYAIENARSGCVFSDAEKGRDALRRRGHGQNIGGTDGS